METLSKYNTVLSGKNYEPPNRKRGLCRLSIYVYIDIHIDISIDICLKINLKLAGGDK